MQTNGQMKAIRDEHAQQQLNANSVVRNASPTDPLIAMVLAALRVAGEALQLLAISTRPDFASGIRVWQRYHSNAIAQGMQDTSKPIRHAVQTAGVDMAMQTMPIDLTAMV